VNAGPARMRRILLFAYACRPNEGSEPGVGWNLALELARRYEVCVVTRSSNRMAISQAEGEIAELPLTFLYVDVPAWLARLPPFRSVQAYYYVWQLVAARTCREMGLSSRFDLAHHLTYAMYWAPSGAAFVGLPFIIGPVGGGDSTPRTLLHTLSWRSRAHEWLRQIIRGVAEWDPLVRSTLRRASCVIASTKATEDRVLRLGARRVERQLQIGLSDGELSPVWPLSTQVQEGELRLICVGRLLGYKGFHLAIEAFAQARLPRATLTVVGHGPERNILERLTKAMGLENQVVFTGGVNRNTALRLIAESDVLVHPSLHDSAGMVVLEAMAAGKPVLCLGAGGPAEMVTEGCGCVVPPDSRTVVVDALAAAMRTLAADRELREAMGQEAVKRAGEYTWRRLTDYFTGLYDDVLQQRPSRQRLKVGRVAAP